MEGIKSEEIGFEMPPAKRRCTESPEGSLPEDSSSLSATHSTKQPSTATNTVLAGQGTEQATNLEVGPTMIPGLGMVDGENGKPLAAESHKDGGDNTMLDALMQHVESIAAQSAMPDTSGGSSDIKEKQGLDITGASSAQISQKPHSLSLQPLSTENETNGDVEKSKRAVDLDEKSKAKQHDQENDAQLPGNRASATADDDNTLRMEHDLSVSLPLTGTTAVEGPPHASNGAELAGAAEWEVDSSPIESSSDSDISSDTTSSEDTDEAENDGYDMLDPEEQAQILMEYDGGSDDEGGGRHGDRHVRSAKTVNEQPDDIIPKPAITVTEDMKIEALGTVECVVESTVLIKAKVSGEYQVLESGSLLCLQDRTVVGVVAETLGRVQQPMYTIRFASDEAVEEARLSEKGTVVYYVEMHSRFVFTQPLRGVKGSDASNFYDEEVGDDEVEFSDDEKEAEYRRQKKAKRKGGNREESNIRNSHWINRRGSAASSSFDGGANGTAYGNGTLDVNYDDVEGGDDGYTPLVRPPNLSEMMASGLPPRPEGYNAFSPRGHERGRRGGRASSSKGHHRGGRGGGSSAGRGRETNVKSRDRPRQPWASSPSLNHPKGPSSYNSGYNARAPEPHMQTEPLGQPPMAPPQRPYQYQQQQPQQPILTPQIPNLAAFSPSPISPLPNSAFNFNPPYQQQQQQQQPPYGGIGYGFNNNNNQTPSPHSPPPAQFPMLPPAGSHMSPAFIEALRRQQQQGQPPFSMMSPPGGYGGHNTSGGPGVWPGNNEAAAAQVRNHLEELRRNHGGGN